MPTIIARLRATAFVKQLDLCCYCDKPMWMSDPESADDELQARSLDVDSTPPSQDLGRNLFAINRAVVTPADQGALSISCGPALLDRHADSAHDAEYELGRDAIQAPHEAKDA